MPEDDQPPAHVDHADSKDRLRLWLRLLRTTRRIEHVLRDRLRTEFDTTLPRFDVMAALYRVPEGMIMSDLSRFLMVSNGNVTGIVDRLVDDGLVIRALREGDRRTSSVRLTDAGRTRFGVMAATLEGWVNDQLSGLSAADARIVAGTLAHATAGSESKRETRA